MKTYGKPQDFIKQALGEVLFINEAYTLSGSKSFIAFGWETMDTIFTPTKVLRDDFIVIADFPALMSQFINSDPCLKFGFNKYIFFEDYTPDEHMGNSFAQLKYD